MNLCLEKFPKQRYTPATTSARATTLTHLAGDGRPIDSNPVHDFSVSHVKTITELVFGVHFRIPRQRIRVRVTGLNSGHAVCFTSQCAGAKAPVAVLSRPPVAVGLCEKTTQLRNSHNGCQMQSNSYRIYTVCLLALLLNRGIAQSIPPGDFFPFQTPQGAVIAIGGGVAPPEVLQVLAARTSEKSPLLILSDAAEDPVSASTRDEQMLKEAGVEFIIGRTAPLTAESQGEILKKITTAGAVWISGGQQQRLAEAWISTDLPRQLQELVVKGGIIAGNSAGAAILADLMITSGPATSVTADGWNLLPDTVVDQHFTERGRAQRSLHAIQQNPGHVGLDIDENTAVLFQQRRLVVLGGGTVSVMLAAGHGRPQSTITLNSGDVADHIQLRRAARQRTVPKPQPRKAPDTLVPNGSLIIVGGGGLPEDIVSRFVSLAGGPEAKIVVLPTAYPPGRTSTQPPSFLNDSEIARITVLPQRGPQEIASKEFQEALADATGIWFGGGRQWNFLDAYENTEAVELFHAVLARGGVIAGSSAGATIQGDLLVRGHPLGNTIMVAEGYEQGFSFLPLTAIDQHFTQRNRQADLLSVVQQRPEFLGIGIDEATAIVVAGNTAEVIGQHSVHLLNAASLQKADVPPDISPQDAALRYQSYATGESFDLRQFIPGIEQ